MIVFFRVYSSITLAWFILYASVDAFLSNGRTERPVVLTIIERFNVNFKSRSFRRWFPSPVYAKYFDFKLDGEDPKMDISFAMKKAKPQKKAIKQGKSEPTLVDANIGRNISKQKESSSESARTPRGKGKTAKPRNTSHIRTEPSHWVVSSDDILFREMSYSLEDSTNATLPSILQFTIRGNPLPLRRHRTSRGFVYNPSAAAQKSFRGLVEELIATHVFFRNVSADTASSHTTLRNRKTRLFESRMPLWCSLQPIAVSIIFRMKRPKSHFVANRPGADRLRKLAPRHMCATSMRTDVDNLAKFVLDSLNGLVYADDRQIVSLHVTKLYDNDDSGHLYQGSTCVCIRLLQDENIPQLLSTAVNMF